MAVIILNHKNKATYEKLFSRDKAVDNNLFARYPDPFQEYLQ